MVKNMLVMFTNASRTLLMNIETLKWDEMLCSIFDIPSIILPAILNNDEIFGYSDVNGILDHEVPICGVIKIHEQRYICPALF